MPDWVGDTVWWHVYPLGFVGAEPAARSEAGVVHRLGHVAAWLDYAAELGATGLSLGPIFDASTHGYDTIDHLRVDPRLGDEADFAALVTALRDRGMRLMLDGVFNHVGRDHPAFRRVLAQGPGAPEGSWFRLAWPAHWQPGLEPDYACFEGHRALVTLNHDEPAVADHVATIMMHWLERGADAWRLDAAYAVPRAFWASVLPRVRARHPDVYVMGEVIHGDYPAIVRESGFDTVTQYELWKAIWSALNDRNLFELGWSLGRHDAFLDAFVPATFVGNHDVTRIASRLADPRHLPHALAVLFTVGGTPFVYAGDEQAFTGVKEEREGGDDAIRPAFPTTPDGLGTAGWPTYALHRALIALRRANPWLHRARTTILHQANAAMLYEAAADGHALRVALNLDDVPIDLPGAGVVAVLAGEAAVSDAAIRLPPHGWAILSTR